MSRHCKPMKKILLAGSVLLCSVVTQANATCDSSSPAALTALNQYIGVPFGTNGATEANIKAVTGASASWVSRGDSKGLYPTPYNLVPDRIHINVHSSGLVVAIACGQ